MKINEILKVIEDLSHSQGFYGRLLRGLREIKDSDPERWDEIVDLLESKNFKEPLDVVLYFET